MTEHLATWRLVEALQWTWALSSRQRTTSLVQPGLLTCEVLWLTRN